MPGEFRWAGSRAWLIGSSVGCQGCQVLLLGGAWAQLSAWPHQLMARAQLMLVQLRPTSLAAVHHMFEKLIRTHDKPVSACYAAMLAMQPCLLSSPCQPQPRHAAPADVDPFIFPTASGVCSCVVSSCVPILRDHQCCLGELQPCCGRSSLKALKYAGPAVCKACPCLTHTWSAGSHHNNVGNFYHSCIGLQLGLCLRSSPRGLSKAPYPGYVDPNLYFQLCHCEPPVAHS